MADLVLKKITEHLEILNRIYNYRILYVHFEENSLIMNKIKIMNLDDIHIMNSLLEEDKDIFLKFFNSSKPVDIDFNYDNANEQNKCLVNIALEVLILLSYMCIKLLIVMNN